MAKAFFAEISTYTARTNKTEFMLCINFKKKTGKPNVEHYIIKNFDLTKKT